MCREGNWGQKGALEQVAAPSRVLSRENHYTANDIGVFFLLEKEGKAVKVGGEVSPG